MSILKAHKPAPASTLPRAGRSSHTTGANATTHVFRALALLFTALLLSAVLPLTVQAVYAENCAGELRTLGLFQGTQDGDQLDTEPTRAQMAVMLTRLLGGEDQALETPLEHPFTDSPSWLSPYLGWLWTNGLVNGTSATSFSPHDPCSADMYCTVLLRALDYSEQEGDFTYRAAAQKALELGIAQWPLWEDGFTRGDMVILSRTALGTEAAGGTQTLLQRLMEQGAVEQETGAAFQQVLEDEAQRRTLLASTRSIMHAGGSLDGDTLINSVDALDYYYAQGHRCFEIDLSLTSDGHIVCLHDWNSMLLPDFEGEPLTLEQFCQSKIHGRYTPTTGDMLLDWLRAHPDAYLFTDAKYDQATILTQLAEMAGELQSRIVPQAYTFSDYPQLRELGYDNVILTLYQLHGSISSNAELIRDYALTHRLLGIAFDKELLTQSYAATLAESGAALFTHTVTSPEEAEYCYRQGVTGVYRD